MYCSDFIETVEELHRNRGVTLTEIAKELKISLRWLVYLRNHQARITPWVLRRAKVAFEDLLEKYPPLVNSRNKKFTQYGFNLEAKTDEAGRKNQARRDRILGIIPAGEDRKIKSQISLNVIDPGKT